MIVSGVLGACPPRDAEEVLSFAKHMGFVPRVLLIHDNDGQLKSGNGEVKVFEKIVRQFPKLLWTFLTYRKRLVRGALHHSNVEQEADTFTLMNMGRSIGVHRLEAFGPKV